MRVLLGLRDVQLARPVRSQDLPERRRRAIRGERHRVGPALLVLGERGQAPDRRPAFAPRPARQVLITLTEAGLGERTHELAHAVGAEVEAQHAVARPDPGLGADERRLDELVRLAPLVGVAHRLLAGLGAVRRPPLHEQLVRTSRAFPAAVAIHRPVAPDDRADAGARLPVELGQEGRARMRQRVAPVGERVHHEIWNREIPRRARSAPSGEPATSERRRRRRARAGAPARRLRRRRAGRGSTRARLQPTASSMRIRSWRTTEPAPRFRWPTSLLPIWPSGSPTARPHAVSVVCGYPDHSSSKTGVCARDTALPGPGSASPQPSRTIRQARGAGSSAGPGASCGASAAGVLMARRPQPRRSRRRTRLRARRRPRARRRRRGATAVRGRSPASPIRRRAPARARPRRRPCRRRARG